MKIKDSVLIRVYRPQAILLREFCEKNFMKQVGLVSRLIEAHCKAE